MTTVQNFLQLQGESTVLLRSEMGDKDKTLDNNGKRLYLGARHALAIMGFLASATMYMQKLDLSIAIVAMAGGGKGDGDENSGGSFCHNNLNSNLSTLVLRNDSTSSVTVTATSDGEVNQAEFDWTPLEKSELLASYYYGNVLSQILAGWLSAKFGFKRVSFNI